MLFEKANETLTVGESLLLSGIGILVVFLELIILALLILGISKRGQQLSCMLQRMLRGKFRYFFYIFCNLLIMQNDHHFILV